MVPKDNTVALKGQNKIASIPNVPLIEVHLVAAEKLAEFLLEPSGPVMLLLIRQRQEKRCHYVTATMSAGDNANAVRGIAHGFLLRWEPIHDAAVGKG